MISYAKSMMFNGHRPEEYGAVLASITSTLPAPRQITDTVPYRDGVYDFSRFDGSLHYDNRTITCVFNIVASDTDELNDRLGKLNDWLYSDGDGMLYDDHDAFWHYEEVYCTDIQKALILADQTAMQVTATMSAYPYRISNSGIKAETINVSAANKFLAYEPNLDSPILSVFPYDPGNTYNINAETIEVIDDLHFMVTLTHCIYSINYPLTVGVPSANIKEAIIKVAGEECLYGGVYNGLHMFSVPKRQKNGYTYPIQVYVTIDSDSGKKPSDFSSLGLRLGTADKSVAIDYEEAPITIESAGLPTITITDSNGGSQTYGPSTLSIDLKEGFYLLNVSGTESKYLSLTYNNKKRRL